MQEILEKLVKGDREAFEKVVKMYEKKMIGYSMLSIERYIIGI